jgi:hypothetical protein
VQHAWHKNQRQKKLATELEARLVFQATSPEAVPTSSQESNDTTANPELPLQIEDIADIRALLASYEAAKEANIEPAVRQILENLLRSGVNIPIDPNNETVTHPLYRAAKQEHLTEKEWEKKIQRKSEHFKAAIAGFESLLEEKKQDVDNAKDILNAINAPSEVTDPLKNILAVTTVKDAEEKYLTVDLLITRVKNDESIDEKDKDQYTKQLEVVKEACQLNITLLKNREYLKALEAIQEMNLTAENVQEKIDALEENIRRQALEVEVERSEKNKAFRKTIRVDPTLSADFDKAQSLNQAKAELQSKEFNLLIANDKLDKLQDYQNQTAAHLIFKNIQGGFLTPEQANRTMATIETTQYIDEKLFENVSPPNDTAAREILIQAIIEQPDRFKLNDIISDLKKMDNDQLGKFYNELAKLAQHRNNNSSATTVDSSVFPASLSELVTQAPNFSSAEPLPPGADHTPLTPAERETLQKKEIAPQLLQDYQTIYRIYSQIDNGDTADTEEFIQYNLNAGGSTDEGIETNGADSFTSNWLDQNANTASIRKEVKDNLLGELIKNDVTYSIIIETDPPEAKAFTGQIILDALNGQTDGGLSQKAATDWVLGLEEYIWDKEEGPNALSEKQRHQDIALASALSGLDSNVFEDVLGGSWEKLTSLDVSEMAPVLLVIGGLWAANKHYDGKVLKLMLGAGAIWGVDKLQAELTSINDGEMVLDNVFNTSKVDMAAATPLGGMLHAVADELPSEEVNEDMIIAGNLMHNVLITELIDWWEKNQGVATSGSEGVLKQQTDSMGPGLKKALGYITNELGSYDYLKQQIRAVDAIRVVIQSTLRYCSKKINNDVYHDDLGVKYLKTCYTDVDVNKLSNDQNEITNLQNLRKKMGSLYETYAYGSATFEQVLQQEVTNADIKESIRANESYVEMSEEYIQKTYREYAPLVKELVTLKNYDYDSILVILQRGGNEALNTLNELVAKGWKLKEVAQNKLETEYKDDTFYVKTLFENGKLVTTTVYGIGAEFFTIPYDIIIGGAGALKEWMENGGFPELYDSIHAALSEAYGDIFNETSIDVVQNSTIAEYLSDDIAFNNEHLGHFADNFEWMNSNNKILQTHRLKPEMGGRAHLGLVSLELSQIKNALQGKTNPQKTKIIKKGLREKMRAIFLQQHPQLEFDPENDVLNYAYLPKEQKYYLFARMPDSGTRAAGSSNERAMEVKRFQYLFDNIYKEWSKQKQVPNIDYIQNKNGAQVFANAPTVDDFIKALEHTDLAEEYKKMPEVYKEAIENFRYGLSMNKTYYNKNPNQLTSHLDNFIEEFVKAYR